MGRKKQTHKKVTVNLPVELIKRLEQYKNQLAYFATVSDVVTTAVTEYLTNVQAQSVKE